MKKYIYRNITTLKAEFTGKITVNDLTPGELYDITISQSLFDQSKFMVETRISLNNALNGDPLEHIVGSVFKKEYNSLRDLIDDWSITSIMVPSSV